jgi:hypothetical protein
MTKRVEGNYRIQERGGRAKQVCGDGDRGSGEGRVAIDAVLLSAIDFSLCERLSLNFLNIDHHQKVRS